MTHDASYRGLLRKMPFSWLERLDTLGHKLHLPRRVFRPICDAYEERLCGGSPYISYDDGQTWTSSSASDVSFTFSRKRHDA